MLTLTRKQARMLDQLAIQHLGMPGLLLMENAARGATEAILTWCQTELHQTAEQVRAVIVCGAGNNGGDGLAIARHLDNAGCQVEINLARPPEHSLKNYHQDAATNLQIAHNLGLAIHGIGSQGPDETMIHSWSRATVLVDALLGTGFTGELRESMARVIGAINRARQQGGVRVAAIDLPSGLDADTGQPSNPTVYADRTITLAARKQGFTSPQAQPFLGQVVVRDIGLPPRLIQQVISQTD